MFHTLTQKLSGVFDKLRGKGVIGERDIQHALREIRIALLEADVALDAIQTLMARIKEKALGETVLKSLTPTQMIVKIVHEGLIALLEHPKQSFFFQSHGTSIFLMVGLQGGGKTTMCGKLAHFLKNKKILMASLDVYRPAAQLQLERIGENISVATLPIVQGELPLEIAKRAMKAMGSYDVLLVDTAGRTQASEDMMTELKAIKTLLNPHEVLLVADALSGQAIVPIAAAFHQAVQLTGMCLSRVDGDSRGGSALSLRHCTGQPILFMGTGESPQQGMVFDPKRLADRILDKGDIVGLVEKVAHDLDEEEERKALKRMEKGLFTLNDLEKKLRHLQKIGGVSEILGMIPGLGSLKQQLKERAEKTDFKKQLAILSSMTAKERRDPSLLKGMRKRRIAKGSGTAVEDVNRLLQQFEQMKKMMKSMRGFGIGKF